MTDEEWSGYLKSDRAARSRAKYDDWSNREYAKMREKIRRKREAMEARHAQQRRELHAFEAMLESDFADRKADKENALLESDFKALGLRPGRE